MTTQKFELIYSSPEEKTALEAAKNNPLIQRIRRQFRADGRGDMPLAGPLENIRAFFIRLGSRGRRPERN